MRIGFWIRRRLGFLTLGRGGGGLFFFFLMSGWWWVDVEKKWWWVMGFEELRDWRSREMMDMVVGLRD